jgi:diguanylate cyclase (GGDEF)-like protein
VSRKKSPPAGAAPDAGRAREEASIVVVYGTETGRRLPLTTHDFMIGRSTKCDLLIDQKDVSRKHAQIVWALGRYTIRDLQSSNGVWVNDKRINEEEPLSHGDKIQIGQTLLAFLSEDGVKTRYQEIYRLMTVDALTGAYNRRYWSDALDRECARAARASSSLSIVLFEIDGFMRIFTRHGRLAVEAVLRETVRAARGALDERAILGRLGEREFGVLLPEFGLSAAAEFAERLRRTVETASVSHRLEAIRCTLSLGTAAWSEKESQAADVFALARSALIDAKREGGNRVSVSKDPSCPT